MLVKRRLKNARLAKRLPPHPFRVSAVTDFVTQRIPLKDVQYLAGQSPIPLRTNTAMIVYKYMVADRVDVLEKSMIRFTQPAALNDPFEAFPCFADFKKRLKGRLLQDPLFVESSKSLDKIRFELAVEHILNSEIQKAVNRFGNYFVFLSITKNKNHPLMWAHYADSHSGFVVGFDAESPFFKNGWKMANDGLREVVYSEWRWVVPETGLTGMDDSEVKEATNIGMFFTKSCHWSYEEELRIISHPEAADNTIPVERGHDIYLYEFPVECLKEVILGCKMPNEKGKAIEAILAKRYPHAKLFKATLDDSKFDLKIEPFVGPLAGIKILPM